MGRKLRTYRGPRPPGSNRVDPELMIQLREHTFTTMRRKGRNDNMVWFLSNLLKWSKLDVPLPAIRQAGGGDPKSLDGVFENCDRGIQTMKAWCDSQCSGRWRYEPSGTFMFRSQKDAALFKLRWF